jgi:DNA-binding response OmpR family regulator
MSNQDKVFSREEIMKIVWKKEVKERNVDTHVRRLRNKLLKYKQNLVTRLGFGYGFQTTNLK